MRALLALALTFAVAGCNGVGLWSAPRERLSGATSAASGSSSSGSGSGSGSSGTTTSGTSGSTGSTTTGGSTASSSTTSTSGTTGVIYTSVPEVLGQTPGTITDVAIAADGTLLVVDAANNCLESFDGQGNATGWAGFCSTNGWDTNGPRQGGSQFYGPFGAALSGTTLFVSEDEGQKLRAIDTGGNVSSFSGSGTPGSADGAASVAEFNWPAGICADGAGGLYVADASNNLIRHVDGTGYVQTYAGSSQGFVNDNGAAAEFSSPEAVATDSLGNVYVADMGNCAVRKITPNHDVSTFVLLPFPCDGNHKMYGVAADAAGNVYASDIDDSILFRWRADGTLSAQITGSDLQNPRGIKVDAQGRVLVASTGNGDLLRYSIP